LYSFFFHASFETFSQTTISTLIPFVFVDYAISAKPARIQVILPDGAPEKSFAAVAGRSSVVLSRCPIAADGTMLAHRNNSGRAGVAQRCC
jgi:hypothetical protein